MKYLALGGLLWVATFTIQCSPSPTVTVEPVETPSPAPSPVQTSTLQLATSTSSASESIETPIPSSTPSQTPHLTPATTESITPAAQASQTPAEGAPQLKMVVIRAKSQREVQRLRQMGLNLIRIRTVESKETPDSKEALLEGEFLVEVVVPTGILAKLRRLGFEVTEVP
jgi:hypothetical protein